MKTCSDCKLQKPFADFYKQSGRMNGIKSYCKTCSAARCRKRRLANPNARVMDTERSRVVSYYREHGIGDASDWDDACAT